MKKTVFLLALLAGATGTAQAQSKLTLGLKAGATLSSYTGDDAGTAKNKLKLSRRLPGQLCLQRHGVAAARAAVLPEGRRV